MWSAGWYRKLVVEPLVSPEKHFILALKIIVIILFEVAGAT